MDKRLTIDLGTLLVLEFDETNRRLKSELIGMDPGNFLLIRMPANFQERNLSRMYPKGTTLIVRYVYEGSVFGFQSYIVSYMLQPSRLIFLSYPEEVEGHNLRSARRINCFLPATLKSVNHDVHGFIIDLSNTGCRFRLKAEDMEDSDELHQLHLPVILKTPIPGVAQELDFTGEVRNVKVDSEVNIMGIQFVNLDPESQEYLNHYLEQADTL